MEGLPQLVTVDGAAAIFIDEVEALLHDVSRLTSSTTTDSPREGDGPARHLPGVARHAGRAWSCSRSARSSSGRTGWPRLRIQRQMSALVCAETPSIRQYPILLAGRAPHARRGPGAAAPLDLRQLSAAAQLLRKQGGWGESS